MVLERERKGGGAKWTSMGQGGLQQLILKLKEKKMRKKGGISYSKCTLMGTRKAELNH